MKFRNSDFGKPLRAALKENSEIQRNAGSSVRWQNLCDDDTQLGGPDDASESSTPEKIDLHERINEATGCRRNKRRSEEFAAPPRC